ncbi:MAG: NAD(P)/FAD-dependent oxidoreductase [Alphaproteobacteria bacterium]|nr:NAD(P)/FAD-dependent oxidoreductase [Alphaproteobacteria bacterium]
MEQVECVVIGAGVVGLAVARALVQSGCEGIVLEAASSVGTGISSRNSEVIHGGIYYPTGSLKGRLCVAGRQALYHYCGERGLAHQRCGKFIVATEAGQENALRALMDNGLALGVSDLEWLDGDAARSLEPALSCVAAIHSPSTGIIDSHALRLSFQGDIDVRGGVIVLRSPVIGADVSRAADGGGIVLDVGGDAPIRLGCRVLVNCAGLDAPGLARRFLGLSPAWVPPLFLAKGNYFLLGGRAPFERLIYPMPETDALGVHLTLDLAGQARFGPDVEWVETIDYRVDPRRGVDFYAAVRRYWPGLTDGALRPGYAGIRPKIGPKGAPFADFMIQGEADHGSRGLVNLFGIDSPGLTASMAIAEHVAKMVR